MELMLLGNTWTGGLYVDKESNVFFSGTFYGTYTIPSKDLEDNKEITLKSKGTYDLIIMKFNKAGKIYYIDSIGGTNRDYARTINILSNGDYIVSGYSNGDIEILAEDTVKNERILLEGMENGSYRGFIIKYTQDNKVEWALNTDWIYYMSTMIETNNSYVFSCYHQMNGKLTIPGSLTDDKNDITLPEDTRDSLMWINKDGKIENSIKIESYSLAVRRVSICR